jgi:hypothetical protein
LAEIGHGFIGQVSQGYDLTLQDPKPITTISLGPGSRTEVTYEESQVQDSFKLVSTRAGAGEDTYYLFTDSNEDRETVLEGLAIAIGA